MLCLYITYHYTIVHSTTSTSYITCFYHDDMIQIYKNGVIVIVIVIVIKIIMIIIIIIIIIMVRIKKIILYLLRSIYNSIFLYNNKNMFVVFSVVCAVGLTIDYHQQEQQQESKKNGSS